MSASCRPLFAPLAASSSFCLWVTTALIGIPAHAESLMFRCTQANGKVTYSDAKCNERGNLGKETTLTIQDAPPPPPPPPPPPVKAAAPKAAPRPMRPKGAAPPPFYNNGKPPTIFFYYDPANAPPEHGNYIVEKSIKEAIKAWEAGCQVHIEYLGRTSVELIKPGEALAISWAKEYQDAHHPSHSGVGVGGTGAMWSGIKLRPRKATERLYPESAWQYLRHVIAHEMGHVLGLAHNHEDKMSVMSYQYDYKLDNRPDAIDYRECNFAMQELYDVDFKPSASEIEDHQRERMTDRQILEKQYGRDPARK